MNTTTSASEREAEFLAMICRVPPDEREAVLAMLATVAGNRPSAGE